MQYLVDDLLLLARLETQKKKTKCVDVPLLIKKICQENSGVEKYGERIELSLESECKIVGEEQDLLSAFTNLLINALKYSADDTSVKVIWKKTTGNMVFEVIDQGEGISAVDISRVTERFYRVDAKRTANIRGTGLGLAIVKHVLIRHDAKLEISSKLGKGSCFRCVFHGSRIC